MPVYDDSRLYYLFLQLFALGMFISALYAGLVPGKGPRDLPTPGNYLFFAAVFCGTAVVHFAAFCESASWSDFLLIRSWQSNLCTDIVSPMLAGSYGLGAAGIVLMLWKKIRPK